MELLVQAREILGKKVKAIRKQGLIPAELYGHRIKNLHLTVPAKEFLKIFKEAGESTIIQLKIIESQINADQDADKRGYISENQRGNLRESALREFNVLIHDLTKNSLTDEISHIDFYSVRMDEKIKTRVPLKFLGEAPAVKEKDGVLIKSVYELEVEALPGDLPSYFEIELSKLSEIGDCLLVSNLKTNSAVKILADSKTVIATIVAKEEEKIEAPTPVEAVKVEGEEKQKEEKQKEEKREEKRKT